MPFGGISVFEAHFHLSFAVRLFAKSKSDFETMALYKDDCTTLASPIQEAISHRRHCVAPRVL